MIGYEPDDVDADGEVQFALDMRPPIDVEDRAAKLLTLPSAILATLVAIVDGERVSDDDFFILLPHVDERYRLPEFDAIGEPIPLALTVPEVEVQREYVRWSVERAQRTPPSTPMSYAQFCRIVRNTSNDRERRRLRPVFERAGITRAAARRVLAPTAKPAQKASIG